MIYKMKSLPVAEMETVRESLSGYQARLIDVHSSLDQKNRELWEMAHHDALTGAKNRRAFEKYWHDIQGLLAEQRFSVCFILFDLNHLSKRNIVLHLAQIIIESGHTLVAEGIETRDLLEQVRSVGFEYGQGWYFGCPLEVGDIAEQEGVVPAQDMPKF